MEQITQQEDDSSKGSCMELTESQLERIIKKNGALIECSIDMDWKSKYGDPEDLCIRVENQGILGFKLCFLKQLGLTIKDLNNAKLRTCASFQLNYPKILTPLIIILNGKNYAIVPNFSGRILIAPEITPETKMISDILKECPYCHATHDYLGVDHNKFTMSRVDGLVKCYNCFAQWGIKFQLMHIEAHNAPLKEIGKECRYFDPE